MRPDLFRLDDKVAVITGGAGLLGQKHAEAILSAGGHPVLLDVDTGKIRQAQESLKRISGQTVVGITVDITDEKEVQRACDEVLRGRARVDILINNAAMTVESNRAIAEKNPFFAPFEEYPVELWEKALQVGLTGAFLCSRTFGSVMAERGSGVVINIASDVGTISPDHRIYRPDGDYPGVPFNTPVSYVAVKGALINMTRYLATYWAPQGVRVNALSPAGVFNNHDEGFVKKLTDLIPLGRMATPDEYQGAILFLCSDASEFMTGFNLIMDGGRTAW